MKTDFDEKVSSILDYAVEISLQFDGNNEEKPCYVLLNGAQIGDNYDEDTGEFCDDSNIFNAESFDAALKNAYHHFFDDDE